MIPIVEEQLRVGKRQVVRGGVRVRADAVETPVHGSVSLRQEHVDVERRTVDTPVTDALFRGQTLELAETAEQAVIARQARVVKQVVRKDATERVETVNDTERHTEADVKHVDVRGVERT